MKTAKLLILFVLLAGVVKAQNAPKTKKTAASTPAPAVAANQLPTDELFEHYVLKHTEQLAADGYGLTPGAPIPVGAYEEDISDEKKINAQIGRFLKTYLWADGKPLVYVSRKSAMVNNVNVESFKVTEEGGKDTITIYADMYKTGVVMLPKGLAFYSKKQLAAEFAPIVDLMKKYDAMPDKFGDAATKASSFEILSFIQSYVGLDFLMDKDQIGSLLNDVGIDMDLKAVLVRSYMFHKLEYMATGQEDAVTKAYNAMVDDYQQTVKAHDIFGKGNVANYMVKK